jgi:hypothetical protein
MYCRQKNSLEGKFNTKIVLSLKLIVLVLIVNGWEFAGKFEQDFRTVISDFLAIIGQTNKTKKLAIFNVSQKFAKL